MLKKINKMSKLYCIVGIFLLLSIIIAESIFFYRTVKRLKMQNNQTTIEFQGQLQGTMRSGYRAIADIAQGDLITEGTLEYVTELHSDVPQDYFIKDSDIGKMAVIPISTGMPILTNMVDTEFPENYHEMQCDFIWLSANLVESDYVDIRIVYPNGVDKIVVAKTALKAPDLGINRVYLWLTEEDILSLNAAVVDANLHDAKIYTVKYVKPSIQEPSIVNYDPNESVILLMQNNPNIVQASARALSVAARQALEKQLELFKEAHPNYTFSDQLNAIKDKQGALGETELGDTDLSPTDGELNPDGTIDGVNDTESTTDNYPEGGVGFVN